MNSHEAIHKEQWQGILIYAAQEGKKIHPITFELIGKALELAKPLSCKVSCILIGHEMESALKELSAYDVERIFVYDHEAFRDFKEDIVCNAFAACIDTLKPSVVLIGATDSGKSIAPSVATRFHSGLTADCTELTMQENSDLVQIRPAFGGNIMARIITANHRPQFATVRYGIMAETTKSDSPHVEIVRCILEENQLVSAIEITLRKEMTRKSCISEAAVLVVAGQGFKSKDDLWMVEELASVLNGQVGSTRALVEKGWFSQENQVGLSGKTVKPDVIITCGVSGSVQFAAGMRLAKNIIAINSDPKAPIFSIAHQSLCGDIYEILPKLIQRIKSLNAGQ